MIKGHGDDLYRYKEVRTNFSSNIFNHFDHSGLFRFLSVHLPLSESYPEPEPYSLEHEIADSLKISARNVIATNGATEAIYLVAQRFHGHMSYIVQPTFSEYHDACRINGHDIRNVFSLEECPEESQCGSADDGFCKILWICNPNNPTGKVTDKNTLMHRISTNPHTLFVIDESYAAYTCKNLLSARETINCPNVIALRSMTKDFGIPGLRLGYVIGNAEVIESIRSIRMPWSVNTLAIEAGKYLLRNKGDYTINAQELCKERERVEKKLSDIGIATTPSDTNILLCRLHEGDATNLKDFLANEHGMLIRDAGNFVGLTPQHFRIAIQLPEENTALIKYIKEWTTSHH